MPSREKHRLGRRFWLVCWAIAPLALAQQAPTNIKTSDWWKHMTVLAADDMQGRDTGSPGLRKAEAYVVDQLNKAGLQPGGSTGYYQPIPLQAWHLVEQKSRVELVQNGKSILLAPGTDYVLNLRLHLAPRVDAPLVFAGYGLSVPESNYDDLAGLDLRGKVAVIVNGSPASIPPALASHYQTAAERWKALRKAGALGMITIRNPLSADTPWSRIALNRLRPGLRLIGKQFDQTEGEQLALLFNPDRADELLRASGHNFRELAGMARDRKPIPHFPLAVSIRARIVLQRTKLQSANIVAKLQGNDPKLKNEYVVLSAHIDHLGVGAPILGDRIYNGALDNAAGCAVLLDIASQLEKDSRSLRRSLLFVFFTGEEKGLLGSKYFTARSPIDLNSIVGDINVDMFLPIVSVRRLTVYGLEESSLGDMAREVAQSAEISLQPDPQPQHNSFIRSDQYSFVLHGIPALMIKVAPTTPEEEGLYRRWMTTRYHSPTDDLNQPINQIAARTYEDIIRELALKVASDPERPHWKPDSFYRRISEDGSGLGQGNRVDRKLAALVPTASR